MSKQYNLNNELEAGHRRSVWHHVIYFSPSDHPGVYVTRAWEIVPGKNAPVPDPSYRISPTLENARSWIPYGAVLLARNENDDPVIVETWI